MCGSSQGIWKTLESLGTIQVSTGFHDLRCGFPYGFFTEKIPDACHKCLIENDELNNTRLNGDKIVLKTPENMKDYVDRGIASQYSLHNIKNIFWKHP